MATLNLSQVEAAAAVELNSRKKMALKMFRPQPGEQERFFEMPRAKFTLLIGGNRSGKTTCSAVMFAAIAMDVPVTLEDGTEIDLRMPWQKGRKLTMWVIGDGEDHLGKTVFRVLCQSNLFNVVTDPVTKELRAKRPSGDEGLKTKPSPPLIPARYIKKIAWTERAKNIFDTITIHDPATGEELAMICGYSSKGPPKAGDPVDIIFVDERISHNAGYVSELKGRLIDAGNGLSDEGSGGQFFWSSWPSEESDELKQFNEIIESAIQIGRPDVGRKVCLTMSGNVHIDQKEVQSFLVGFTEDERAARDKGLFVSTSLRTYPLFDRFVHSAIIDDQQIEDQLSRELRKTDGIPPNSWTKYLALDPGTDHPAVLLCAVPPPEFGDYIIPYQEFYPGRYDAIQLANLVKREMPNEKYYRFIIDWKAGGQTPPGMLSRIVDGYQSAWLGAGLTCHLTEHLFSKGSSNVGGRQLILSAAMHPTRTGLPKLRIVTHRCPQLCNQLIKVKKDVIRKEVVDERKAAGIAHDVVDCLEYVIASNPYYIYIKPSLEDASPAFQRYMKKFGQKKDTSLSIGTYY